MAAAAETFRLLTWPAMGMAATKSHRSRTSRRRPWPSAPTTSAVGYCQIQLIVWRFGLGVQPHRPDPGLLEFLERPRDVDDVRDRHVMHGAGRCLGRRAVERRRPPRLPDDAGRAGGVDRAQDRADVLRILDAVEHDDQRRARVRAARGPSSVGCRAALRRRRRRPDGRRRRASRSSASRVHAARRRTPRAAASSSTRRRRSSSRPATRICAHASRAQRLGDGVDAVDRSSRADVEVHDQDSRVTRDLVIHRASCPACLSWIEAVSRTRKGSGAFAAAGHRLQSVGG